MSTVLQMYCELILATLTNEFYGNDGVEEEESMILSLNWTNNSELCSILSRNTYLYSRLVM